MRSMLISQALLFAVVLVIILWFASGCSVSTIVKDCEPATVSTKQICKTIKPWE